MKNVEKLADSGAKSANFLYENRNERYTENMKIQELCQETAKMIFYWKRKEWSVQRFLLLYMKILNYNLWNLCRLLVESMIY